MKKTILTIGLIILKMTVSAQSPKFILSKQEVLPDSILSQTIKIEYATSVRQEFVNRSIYYYRIYGRLRDKGMKSDEVYQRVSILEVDKQAFDFSLDAFYRYCGGNKVECLDKQLQDIGITSESVKKIRNYILYLYKDKPKPNFWDE